MQESLIWRRPCLTLLYCIPADYKILGIVQTALFPDTGKKDPDYVRRRGRA
jgi:hypothetical protein